MGLTVTVAVKLLASPQSFVTCTQYCVVDVNCGVLKFAESVPIGDPICPVVPWNHAKCRLVPVSATESVVEAWKLILTLCGCLVMFGGTQEGPVTVTVTVLLRAKPHALVTFAQ